MLQWSGWSVQRSGWEKPYVRAILHALRLTKRVHVQGEEILRVRVEESRFQSGIQDFF